MHALYITHPQVKIDPAIPVPEWGLSEKGAERTREASRLPWAKALRHIVSSAETKAIETARILAETSGAEIEIVEAMHENDRSATGFLPPPEFEKAADWFFAHPEESFHGWERAIDAQARIMGAVKAILDRHDPRQPIAFVGHGGVGTLLKCHIEGRGISPRRGPAAGRRQPFPLFHRRIFTCSLVPHMRLDGNGNMAGIRQ